MTTRRIALAALAALTAVPALISPALVSPADAQYYREDYGYRPRRPPPDYGYDYDRPRYRDGYGYGPRRFGRICVTARGDCPTRPGPLNTPCGCEIPGFGFKRGAIGG